MRRVGPPCPEKTPTPARLFQRVDRGDSAVESRCHRATFSLPGRTRLAPITAPAGQRSAVGRLLLRLRIPRGKLPGFLQGIDDVLQRARVRGGPLVAELLRVGTGPLGSLQR